MEQDSKESHEEEGATSSLAEQLAELRRQLQRGELDWSETAVPLLRDIDLHTNAPEKISSQDMEMLSLAIDAALQNKDIAKIYPVFHERLQENKDLARLFQDILAAIRDQSPLPPLPPADLSFLSRHLSKPPVVQQSPPHGWKAIWQILPTLLNQRFAPDAAIYRAGQSLLDEQTTLLLFNEFAAGDQTWQATLEAVTDPDVPGQVRPILSVVTEQEPQPALQATLQWGSYRETAVLDTFGRAHFPALPLSLVLDETGTSIAHELRLALQPVQADGP